LTQGAEGWVNTSKHVGQWPEGLRELAVGLALAGFRGELVEAVVEVADGCELADMNERKK
jgi:hypothetical protein